MQIYIKSFKFIFISCKCLELCLVFSSISISEGFFKFHSEIFEVINQIICLKSGFVLFLNIEKP